MDNSVIKAEALSLAEEANKLCRSESLSDEKQGVELFVQAMMLGGGEETDLSGEGLCRSRSSFIQFKR